MNGMHGNMGGCLELRLQKQQKQQHVMQVTDCLAGTGAGTMLQYGPSMCAHDSIINVIYIMLFNPYNTIDIYTNR